MSIVESCSYCSEINGIVENSYFLSEIAPSLDIQSRYLFTSKTFLVFPSVGALVPGHLLIAPKRHITAMANLNIDELSELKGVINELKKLLSIIYDEKIVLMEHGTLNSRISSGACVDHAHIHILPSNVMLSHSINEEKKAISIAQLNNIKYIENDYLLYSDDCENYFYSVVKKITSQYFRKVIFDNGNLEGHWNWVIDHRIQTMVVTIDDIVSFVASTDLPVLSGKWLQKI